MSKKSENQPCMVCGEISYSIRFGAVSCRACAEFFRRKIVSKARIPKRCNGACDLGKYHRKTCQSCRFQKCLKIGMLEKVVASRTPVNRRSENNQTILSGLEKAYNKLENSRDNIFDRKNKIPKYCNHQELDDMFEIDIKLVSTHFIHFFESKSSLENNQKKVLSTHFIIRFSLLEVAFRAFGKPTYILPNNDIIDVSRLDKVYQNLEKGEDERGKNSQVILQRFWQMNEKTMKTEVFPVNLDQSEFLFLCALIYWDFGIENQSEKCLEECQRMRVQVLKELTEYEKSNYPENELRVAQVIGILQALQKTLDVIQQSGYISNVYNLKGKQCPLYKATNE